MKRYKKYIIALLITALLTLSGCELFQSLGLYEFYTVAFEDMEYTRPDMEEIEQTLEQSCKIARESDNVTLTMGAVDSYYRAYDEFYTNYALADIHYSRDLSDEYWKEEYFFCSDQVALVKAGLEELYSALAESPCRSTLETEDYFGQDFFYEYEESNIYDPAYMALLNTENMLIDRYYEITDAASAVELGSEEYYDSYGSQLAELYVELIEVRQEMAEYMEYDGYAEYAYDFLYDRDYLASSAETYLIDVAQELAPLYRNLAESSVWDWAYTYCSETETFEYVKRAAGAMGGSAKSAFSEMEEAGLYDISYGENKYGVSFEIYLPKYYQSFVFVSPYLTQHDKLTFAHEFGHYVGDYAGGGLYAGIDIVEVHSQAMEYLTLCYSEEAEQLTQYKMADSLCVYVEQAAYALFEQQVYDLKGEDLTVENVEALFEKIGEEFGFDAFGVEGREYVLIDHFFVQPMYVISYVVSNDLAMQIYQMERAEKGEGLALYEECLSSEESYLLYFAEEYGLESPFAKSRLESVRQMFEQELAGPA